MRDLQRMIQVEKEQIEAIGDAGDEIFIADDAKFIIGESFCALSMAETEQMLEKSKVEVTASLGSHESSLLHIEARMGLLKAELKAKFGDSIHLENE